jgi:uncharacterized protein YeaO (DUF488 family)
MAIQVYIKRAYDPASSDDGYRVLVDRLWPRGLSKETLKTDAWIKELAPSSVLRTWFGHKIERWDGFRQRYQAELRTPEQRQRILEIKQAAKGQRITLVYGAKDTEHNQAVVLQQEMPSVFSSASKKGK